jgi:DNA gyrase subunit A
MKDTFIVMMTKHGLVKKTSFDQYANIRSNGLIAINLTEGDELLKTALTDGKMNAMIISKGGKAILFKEDEVRSTGRSSQGVKGIELNDGDEVVASDVFTDQDLKKDLIVIGEKGIGKRVGLALFRGQHRGGKGIKIAPADARMGKVAFVEMIPEGLKTVIITSQSGQVVKTSLDNIPKYSRAAKGVIVMRFSDAEDKVVSATFIE